MKRPGLLGVALALTASTSVLAAVAPPPTGPNTITGHAAPPAGQAACGAGTVYLYVTFPDFSGADGGARSPPFEIPAADSVHWEAPCKDGMFTFSHIPDGAYMAGLPAMNAASRTLTEVVTVEGGKSVEIELKPEAAER